MKQQRQKHYFALVAAAMFITACGGTEIDEKDNKAYRIFSYRYSETDCDTYERTFFSREELCENLQLSYNNNACAVNDRKALFNRECDDFGYTWNNDKQEDAYLKRPGRLASCQLTEPNGFVVDQYIRGERGLLTNKTIMLLVDSQEVSGKLKMYLSLMDKATEKTFNEKGGIFDLSDTVQITIGNANNVKAPYATCSVVVKK